MRKLGECDDAVSPIIGAILMVGLTVIMVSVIAVSVFTFTNPESAPHAKIVVVEAKGDIGYTALNKSFITLKHKGGDALFENDTQIIITGKGYAYASGSDPYLHDAKDMRATYRDLAGKNYISGFDNEIVEGTSWDAGETITLYGSDGNDLYLYDWHNNADSRWKLDDGTTVSVTIIDITTNQVITVSQATVKHP
jgi:FlaG/FlaF family flagellin (archaellin)